MMKHSFGPDLYMKGQAFCKCDALVIMTKPTFLTFDYMYNEQLIGSKGPIESNIKGRDRGTASQCFTNSCHED